jgi:TusA-related sulfurtransferase
MEERIPDSSAGRSIVDARGMLCPEPLVLTRLALNAADVGQLIEVWVTDPLAPLDLEALCARTGDHYCGLRELEDGVLAVGMRKRVDAGR